MPGYRKYNWNERNVWHKVDDASSRHLFILTADACWVVQGLAHLLLRRDRLRLVLFVGSV